MEAQVLQLHNQGKNPAEISKELGVPLFRVITIINSDNG